MDMEAQVAEAIAEELKRQAEESGGSLTVSTTSGSAEVSGRLDLEALAMVVVGAVAGGP